MLYCDSRGLKPIDQFVIFSITIVGCGYYIYLYINIVFRV